MTSPTLHLWRTHPGQHERTVAALAEALTPMPHPPALSATADKPNHTGQGASSITTTCGTSSHQTDKRPTHALPARQEVPS